MSINPYLKNYRIVCSECNKERFVTYAQHRNIVRSKNKLCRSCVMKGNNWGFKKGQSAWNKKYFNFICEICKKEFSIRNGKKHRFCSKDCDNEARRIGLINGGQFLKGELHPNWVNGKSDHPYPKTFNQLLKEKIRKRDNYQCQNKECNMTEEEHLIVYGKVLDIHHIDYNKDNINPDNLISLCKQCNARANFNRDYWEKYFKELLCAALFS